MKYIDLFFSFLQVCLLTDITVIKQYNKLHMSLSSVSL